MCRDFGEGSIVDVQGQMPFVWISKTVESLVFTGLREVIPSTMGEPFLYSHFESLLGLLLRTGVRLNVTTNGTFPNGGVEFWVPKVLPVLSDMKISIQALDVALNEEIMRGVDAKAQQKNILQVIRARDHATSTATVTLQITAQQKNASDLPALLHWAITNGVDRVKLNQVRIHSPKMQEQYALSQWEWDSICKHLREMVDTEYNQKGQKIKLICQGLSIDNSGPCPFLGREVWVMANGDIRVCPHPCYTEGAFPDLGSLAKGTEVVDAFQSSDYQALMNTYESREFCQKCSFRLNLNP